MFPWPSGTPGGRVRVMPEDNREPPASVWLENQGSWLLHTLPYMEQQSVYQIFSPYLRDGQGANCGAGRELCSIRQADNGVWKSISSPAYARCPSYSHNYEEWPAATYGASV